jgi:hypothetical protein
VNNKNIGGNYMNNVERFYRDGSLTINVNYKPTLGSPIICLNKGLWYKFQIDKIEKLEDKTYNIITEKLLSIDDKLIDR